MIAEAHISITKNKDQQDCTQNYPQCHDYLQQYVSKLLVHNGSNDVIVTAVILIRHLKTAMHKVLQES